MISREPRRFTSICGIALVTLLLTARSGDADSPPVRISPETGVPELVFYHGMVLNDDLQVIDPTPENVSRIMRLFTEGLAAGSPDDATRLRFSRSLRDIQGSIALDNNTEVLTYAALSRSLLRAGDRPRRASLQSMSKALEAWASIPAGEGIDLRISRNAPLAAKLKSLGLELAREQAAPALDYITQCRNAGVPIPPDFGEPGWQELYPLDPAYSFVADSNSIAKVWVYVDPNAPTAGMCVGLPREDRLTGEIGLFGIICQSKASSKACFWDNIDKATGKRLSDAESRTMKIADIEDGSMLGENCTNCHRGRNAFNIHPRTSLDFAKVFPSDTDAWYEPISGQSTWGNPGPITFQDDSQCSACHALPEVADDNNTGTTKSYCRILRQVVDKTMPKGGLPAGWLNPRTDERDINLLRGKCGGP